jgi:antitoxin YefM
MSTVTIKHAKEQLEKWQAALADGEPVIVTTEEGEQGVVMPLEFFLKLPKEDLASWQETLYLLSNPANAKHLLESIAEIEKGKFQKRELIEP